MAISWPEVGGNDDGLECTVIVVWEERGLEMKDLQLSTLVLSRWVAWRLIFILNYFLQIFNFKEK